MALALFCLPPLAIVALFAAYAAWRTRLGRRVRVRAVVTGAFVVQAMLVIPVALLAALTHRSLHPNDDWFDIAGFAAGAVQCFMLPLVVGAVWWISLGLERRRQRRFPSACWACGYDLSRSGPRGSSGPRCPECGACAGTPGPAGAEEVITIGLRER